MSIGSAAITRDIFLTKLPVKLYSPWKGSDKEQDGIQSKLTETARRGVL